MSRLGIVFGAALVGLIHHAKIDLRPLISLFSRPLIQSERFRIVSRIKRRHPILWIPRRHGRRGEQHEGDQGAQLRSVAKIDGG